MMRKSEAFGSWHVLGLVVAALLAASISSVPAPVTLTPGSGNLGGPGAAAGSSTVSASLNPTYTVNPTTGQSIASVRDALVALIDADPNFAASSYIDPNDPNSNSFRVSTQSGDETSHLNLCESDPNIDNLGVSFPSGRDAAKLNIPTQINGNGNYVLSISTWDHGTTTQTFNTTIPPNNTAAGLNSSIVSTFTAAGFSVTTEASDYIFRRPGDMITALRTSSSDTGQVTTCIDVLKMPSPSIPTVSELGTLLLVLLLISTAIWMLRRKGATHSTRS